MVVAEGMANQDRGRPEASQGIGEQETERMVIVLKEQRTMMVDTGAYLM